MPGYVDEYGSGEIFGWATDPEPNETLPVVICRADDGRSMEFRAIQYRGDVCQAVGRQGTFGFAIPIERQRKSSHIFACAKIGGYQRSRGTRIALSIMRDCPDISRRPRDIPGGFLRASALSASRN